MNSMEVRTAKVRLTRGDHDEPFEFALCDDGTGTFFDVDYNERLDISHDLTAADFDILLSLKNGAVAHDGDDIEEDDLPADLQDSLDDLFETYNEQLSDPVGDPPSDEREMSVGKGSEGEFYTALAATLYLANLAHIGDGQLRFYYEDDDDGDYDEIPDELSELVYHIADVFELNTGYSFEYTDQNDGRVTSHSKSTNSVSMESDEIETYLPSARERIEARRILKELLVRYGGDPSIVDATFPVLTQSNKGSDEDHGN